MPHLSKGRRVGIGGVCRNGTLSKGWARDCASQVVMPAWVVNYFGLLLFSRCRGAYAVIVSPRPTAGDALTSSG